MNTIVYGGWFFVGEKKWYISEKYKLKTPLR